MPTFAYRIHGRDGRRSQGRAEAADAQALAQSLREAGHLVLGIDAVADARPADPPRWRTWLTAWSRPRPIDLEMGLRQLSFQVRSGISLVTALQTCSEQAERPAAARLWRHLAKRIEEGQNVTSALRATPGIPALILPMASVGEETGTLDAALARAADALERRRALRAQLLTALSYPGIVLVMAVGAACYMLIGVIPKLQALLSAHGRSLPAITQALIDLSMWLRLHGAALTMLLAGLVAVIAVMVHWAPGRLAIDSALLRLPMLGRLLRTAGAATICRSLAALLSSGVRVTDALSVAGDGVANRRLRRYLDDTRHRVLAGQALGASLQRGRMLPPLTTGMISVGETAGTLDEVLGNLAVYHEEQVHSLIRRLAALIEPMVIILVGGIVGFVYLSFFAAIYSIIGGR